MTDEAPCKRPAAKGRSFIIAYSLQKKTGVPARPHVDIANIEALNECLLSAPKMTELCAASLILPGAPGASGCQYDDDLHACAESRRKGRSESCRPVMMGFLQECSAHGRRPETIGRGAGFSCGESSQNVYRFRYHFVIHLWTALFR